MNIAITNFNFKSKEISPLLGTFNDYEIKRVDYCINISFENFGLSNIKNKREKHRAHNRCITDTSRLYALCFSLLTPEGVHAVKPDVYCVTFFTLSVTFCPAGTWACFKIGLKGL